LLAFSIQADYGLLLDAANMSLVVWRYPDATSTPFFCDHHSSSARLFKSLLIMKLSFSMKPAKKEAPKVKAPPPKPALFSGLEEDDGVDAPPPLAYKVEASKAMQKRIEKEKAVDSTVYDYDEVWERMQEVKDKQKAAKAVEAVERKVRLPSRGLAHCGISRLISRNTLTAY
jgi:Coiled-coil domain-containing protein 55 (DUF2040)